MGLLDDFDKRRERVGHDAENSARLAQAYAVFTTTGQGTVLHQKRIAFGVTFVEKPMVSYGCVVDLDQLAEDLGHDEDTEPTLPLCTGYVTEWDQDERGFYIGCWVAIRVYYPPILEETLET